MDEPLIEPTASEDAGVRIRTKQVIVTLAFAVAFASYCEGLRCRFVLPTSAEIRDGGEAAPAAFGYTKSMLLCGVAWLVWQLAVVWLWRPVELRYFLDVIRRSVHAEALVSEEKNDASEYLVNRARFSFSEALGIIFGVSLWVPDPIPKKMLRKHPGWDALISVDVVWQFGFIVFWIGLLVAVQSVRQKCDWMRKRLRDQIAGVYGGAWWDDDVHGNLFRLVRHPEHLGYLLLYFGWALVSCNTACYLIPIGAFLEYRLSEIPALEHAYALLLAAPSGPRALSWNAYKKEVRWALCPGLY